MLHLCREQAQERLEIRADRAACGPVTARRGAATHGLSLVARSCLASFSLETQVKLLGACRAGSWGSWPGAGHHRDRGLPASASVRDADDAGGASRCPPPRRSEDIVPAGHRGPPSETPSVRSARWRRHQVGGLGRSATIDRVSAPPRLGLSQSSAARSPQLGRIEGGHQCCRFAPRPALAGTSTNCRRTEGARPAAGALLGKGATAAVTRVSGLGRAAQRLAARVLRQGSVVRGGCVQASARGIPDSGTAYRQQARAPERPARNFYADHPNG